MSTSVVVQEAQRVKQDLDRYRSEKLDRLKNLDLFILDNSIRESTVGQLRSHTLENKKAIFAEVKKCGLEHIMIASFSHMTRVDDDFCQHLVDSGEDFTNLYAFSEVFTLKNGRYDAKFPVALEKAKKYGIRNIMFESDIANPECKWGDTWTVQDHCQMLLKLFRWVRTELHKDAKIMVNLRDLTVAMSRAPERLLEIVHFISSLPPEERIFSLAYEDIVGDSVPEELGVWTASVRKVMNSCGWADGKFIVHVHQQWDLQTASALSCLSNGADGVWASVCEEGASVGHACYSVTVMNLVRFGNKKVLKKFNCVEMRNAARVVTKITTGKNPHPKQVLYGERALDMVFGMPLEVVHEFDIHKFYGVKPVNRMNTLASPEMIRDRLVNVFGEDSEIFTLEIAAEMKKKMLEDLRSGHKEEYMSEVGLALLFDRAGGSGTEQISDIVLKAKVENPHHQNLIDEIRTHWNTWDLQDEVQNDDRLQFDSFYHGFMAPYFGCYRCDLTRQGLQCLDMDSDGYVDWKEFLVYVKWALHQYPDVANADELLDLTFQKGIIPAMRDEQLKDM